MESGMWVQIELPEATEIQRIVMDSKGSPTDSPIEYTIGFSMDGEKWETTKAQKGTKGVTIAFSASTEARFIRITQTGKSERYYWSMHELQLFGN